MGSQLFDLALVDAADDVEQAEEHRLRVGEVKGRFLERGRAHRLDVEADAFAVPAEAVLLEHPDLVERPAQVDRAEDLVLVVFQPVLVVQMDAPELVVIEGVGHVVGGIEPGQNRMGALDQDAGTAGSIVW